MSFGESVNGYASFTARGAPDPFAFGVRMLSPHASSRAPAAERVWLPRGWLSQRRRLSVLLLGLVFLTSCLSTRPTPGGSPSPTGTTPPVTATPDAVPECIRRGVLEAPEGQPPRVQLPVPELTPLSGRVGDQVTLTGTGMKPGASLDILALFGGNNCEIAGRSGDHLLGHAKAGADGRYQFRATWPQFFSPYLGSGRIPKTALPAGNYYIVVLACGPSCGRFHEGAGPGGPFLLAS